MERTDGHPAAPRLFVAVDLPGDVQHALLAAQRVLRQAARGFRWVRPTRAHLTLAFLGETPEASLPGIEAVLAAAAASEAPFDVDVQGLGSFGHGQAPAVLWLGMLPCPPLMALQARLAKGLAEAGFAVDRRPFLPHLTLGRAVTPRPNPRLLAWLQARGNFGAVRMPVDRLRLYRSELGEAGAVYTPLATARLGRGGPAQAEGPQA